MRPMTNIFARLEDSRSVDAAGWLEPLALGPESGYVPQSLNLGFPQVREVVDRKPSANGSFDYTTLFGERAVQLIIGIADELIGSTVTDTALEDALRGWMLPSLRPYLYYKRSEAEPERRILLRASSLNRNLNFARTGFDLVSMQWKAPLGVSESAELVIVQIVAGGGDIAGREYPKTYPKTYPASSPVGTKVVTNLGNAPALPFVTLYGPAERPSIENVTTGAKIQFADDFTLTGVQRLEIDFDAGTVLLDGDPNNSRYHEINFAVSDWWTIERGDNTLRFQPLNPTEPAYAQIEYRHTYL